MDAFRHGLQHDFLHAGGFLVLGAAAAATFNVAMPPSVLHAFAGSPWLSVALLGGLAVILSICSEADAFVAASLAGFSSTARLAFMVVGPMVDLKLIARYVKEGLRPFLVICGAVLVLLGVADALLRLRGTAAEADTGHPGHDKDDDHGHPHDHGHGHGHAHAGSGLRTAWLLTVPAVLLLVAAPPALGSYTVARDGSGAIARRADFPPLPPQGTLALSLTDFTTRAVWDDKESLKGRTVRLEGFVTPKPGGMWQLSRVIVSCCAADARVVDVEIHGVGTPQANTWVTVTGVWRPAAGTRVPALDATGLTVIPQPKNPYRDAPPDPDTRTRSRTEPTCGRPAAPSTGRPDNRLAGFRT